MLLFNSARETHVVLASVISLLTTRYNFQRLYSSLDEMTLPPLMLSFHETWFQKHCSGVLDILAVPYGIAVKTRAGLYEWGWMAQRRLPRPVISVGNLTVGGTGKTPVVMWLANWLQAQGVQVGILSRGYRRPDESKFLLVSDGQNVLTTHEESGDEPFLMARSCPGVVIAVGSDRYQLGRWVLDRFPIDLFYFG